MFIWNNKHNSDWIHISPYHFHFKTYKNKGNEPFSSHQPTFLKQISSKFFKDINFNNPQGSKNNNNKNTFECIAFILKRKKEKQFNSLGYFLIFIASGNKKALGNNNFL